MVWKGSQWAVLSLLCCSAQRQDAPTPSRTDEPTVISWYYVGTHAQLQYFSSKKTLSLGYFHSLTGISLLQEEVWNRLIYVNCY